MFRARQCRHGLIIGIGQARDRMAAAAALDPGIELRRQQLCPGRAGDPEGIRDHRGADRGAAEHDRDRLPTPQHLGNVRDDMRRDLFRRDGRKRRAIGSAVVPARIRRRDQGRDLAMRRARRLHGRGRVDAHGRNRLHDAGPRRYAARPSVGVSGQGRIERTMIARLIADHVDDRRARAAGIVQDWPNRSPGRARRAATCSPAFPPSGRSRRRRPSPRLRTGTRRSACPARDRARRRNASRWCRDLRNTS